jgi:ferritin
MELSANMIKMLTQQYRNEMTANLKYTQFRVWCDFTGFKGCYKFFHHEAKEEHTHAHLVLKYILNRNGISYIEPFSYNEPTPKQGTKLIDIFEAAQGLEQSNSQALTEIFKAAQSEGDVNTMTFIAKMLKKQIHEEGEIQDILDRFAIYPEDASRDSDIDNYVGKHFA